MRTPRIPKDILLQEAPSRNSDRTPDIARSTRTALNARDAGGVLIVGDYGPEDAGTVATVAFAHDYGKPIYYSNPASSERERETDDVVRWLVAKHFGAGCSWRQQGRPLRFPPWRLPQGNPRPT